MANLFIYLDSFEYSTGSIKAPTSITPTYKHVGTQRRMANATLKKYSRGVKREWQLTWERAPESTIDKLRLTAVKETSFTFQDTNGVIYTVLIPENGYDEELSASDISDQGVPYYNATLHLVEI